MVRRKHHQSWFKRHHLLMLTAAILLVIAGGAWALKAYDKTQKTNDTAGDGSYVNLSPPTEEEKQETQAHKKELSNSPSPSTTNEGKKQVTPVITSANQDQISAYVPGVFEDGGTCTATLTKGSKTVTKTSEGFKNVSYTSCAPINVSGSFPEKGTWSVVVIYKSSAAEGTSKPTTFEVK